MPFQSEKQRRYMHAKHPEIAQRWEREKKRVAKMEPVVPASRRRPQVAARNAVRRPNREKNPLLASVSKREWSDRRLAGHKRAQSYLSSGGATLGIGALGAAGVAAATKNPRAAQRLTRLTGRSASKIREQANRASPALTTGSAGVGGVGGFNFAAIQSQEAKRGQKVKKSMSISVWGIDHGEPVAKNDERWGRAERTAAALGGAGGALSYNSPLGSVASGIYGSTQARRGRKAAVGARTAGRSLAEGIGGGVGGAALGAAVSRGRLTGLGAVGGTAAGTAHGAGAAMSNARRRGDLKPVSKSAEEDRLAAQRYADRASAYAVGGAAGGAAAGAAYGPARRAGQSAGAGYRLSRSLGSGRVRSVGSAARAAGAGARGGKVGALATGIGAVGGLYGGVGTAGVKNIREETRRQQNG